MENRQVAITAMALGIVDFVVKLLAYFVSNSVALLSDVLESMIRIVR